MKIVRHRLQHDDGTPLRFERSPNSGDQLQHKYLSMHYTAGSSTESAVNTLTNPEVKASAHLVIGRDGEVVQLVPFDRIAWHAGRSKWHGLKGLNKFSIGIELDNAGRLERQGGVWRAWFKKVYPDEEVHEGAHKHESVNAGWHDYSEEQIDAALVVSKLLARRYGLIDVLGHDDIAPGRKSDPGPAFPMESFRSAVIGRQADADEIYEAAANLNIRSGPGTSFEKLVGSPLARGSRLSLEVRDSSWCFVEVLDDDDLPNQTGWVHGDYIRPVD